MTGTAAEHGRPPWNVLVTTQEGASRPLRRLLRRLGTFRASGFRNVILGWVPDVHEFCRGLLTELEGHPEARAWLGRVLPVDLTLDVDPTAFTEAIGEQLDRLATVIGPRSYHVRVERRGHKGVLSTRDLELRFADRLWGALERQGVTPTVSFRDPDVVVAVEIVGDTAGIAVISRELRTAFPFVKID